ncbi:MAG: PDGLE domain-containing protein [Methanosarcina sp.]
MNGKSNIKFLYAGIAIALLLSILAPFLASPDPDGLESAASGVVEKSKLSELEKTEPAVSSPMADYSIKGMGKTGEVLAIVMGTVSILIISFGLGKVFNKKA